MRHKIIRYNVSILFPLLEIEVLCPIKSRPRADRPRFQRRSGSTAGRRRSRRDGLAPDRRQQGGAGHLASKSLAGLERWLDDLPADRLPVGHFIGPAACVPARLETFCDLAGAEASSERQAFVEDVARLARTFAALSGGPLIDLRLDAVAHELVLAVPSRPCWLSPECDVSRTRHAMAPAGAFRPRAAVAAALSRAVERDAPLRRRPLQRCCTRRCRSHRSSIAARRRQWSDENSFFA